MASLDLNNELKASTRLPGYWMISEIAVVIGRSEQFVLNAISGYRTPSGRQVPPRLAAWKAGVPWYVPHDDALSYISEYVSSLQIVAFRLKRHNQGYKVHSLTSSTSL